MYIGGKLLFIGYVFGAESCTEKDLQKQISRTRVDYRLGLSLPSDYKFWYCTTFHLQKNSGPLHSRSLFIEAKKINQQSTIIVYFVITFKAPICCLLINLVPSVISLFLVVTPRPTMQPQGCKVQRFCRKRRRRHDADSRRRPHWCMSIH